MKNGVSAVGVVFVVLLVLFLVGGAGMMGFGGFGMGPGMMGMMGNYGAYGGYPGMMGGYGGGAIAVIVRLVIRVLVLGGIVMFFIWLVRSVSHGGLTHGSNGPIESPVDILKRRYARGEITKEQFDAMRRDVEG